MEKFLFLVQQRRAWAGLVGVLAFIFGILKWKFDVDVAVLTDLLTAFGGALSALVTAGLAIWSLWKPKK